jgi:hypothetical protein
MNQIYLKIHDELLEKLGKLGKLGKLELAILAAFDAMLNLKGLVWLRSMLC